MGTNGKVIGVDDFGASGTSEELRKMFNLTSENIVETAKGMFTKKEFKNIKK